VLQQLLFKGESMRIPDFDRQLANYAELAIKVGLNLQPGQRLLVTNASSGGVVLEAAPLVRQLAAAAYRSGAPFVDVLWADEPLRLLRFQQAPRNSFEEYPDWQVSAALEYIERGDAMLSVKADDPDLLRGQDPGLVSLARQVAARKIRPVLEKVERNATNWLVIAAATPAWAARVFPEAPAAKQVDRLWEAIFAMCRVDTPNPVAAWRAHVADLVARRDYLNAKAYRALHYTGPGTDLTVGLPVGHLWDSAGMPSQQGIDFIANLPTEEVFTLGHRAQVEGTVTASRPLSYGGTLIDGFSVTFAGGRAVNVHAERGEAVLRSLIDTDDGAGRLGEVALVPHGSPISRTGRVFLSTLIDENAASHLAFGAAYRFSLKGAEALTDEAFEAAGGNTSLVHVDFMIGCGELDVDGITADNRVEPVMRRGEWVFDV
jgi:aminopeptidase